MNTRTAVAALALLVALTLTGCAGTVATTPDEPQDAAATSVEQTPEPLVAETTGPTVNDEDAQFLAYVRENLLPETQIPDATDEQLIAAGHDACEQIQSGIAYEDVRVVEGEQPHENDNYYDTSAIMNGAVLNYCPELG